jgi:hypothetical protein
MTSFKTVYFHGDFFVRHVFLNTFYIDYAFLQLRGIILSFCTIFRMRGALKTAKLGASFEFVKRFCKWCKPAIILMFISPVALFVIMMKFEIDHHHGELYFLCRWIKQICESIGNRIKYRVTVGVGVRIFPANIFILCTIIDL